MILPGISGSFILVMIGMYTEIIGAVNDRNLAVLTATGIGCVIGLATFSTLLKWLLDRYHDVVIAAMAGLMLGSVRVLWPWPVVVQLVWVLRGGGRWSPGGDHHQDGLRRGWAASQPASLHG